MFGKVYARTHIPIIGVGEDLAPKKVSLKGACQLTS